MSKFPFPIPHGWFGLCFSHDLKVGEVKKVRFCGRNLVVFRTESGQAAALALGTAAGAAGAGAYDVVAGAARVAQYY